MNRVSVVGFAQSDCVRNTHGTTNGVEMLVPILAEAFERTGLSKEDIGFWCSGSSDYLAGRAFSFISAVDAIGAFPPINESHVEMDAAWALYEAWVKILTGEVETALVYGFGKSSAGTLRRVLSLQTDPYTVAPLWPDSVSIAAMQARLGLESGRWSEKDMAEVAARSLADARGNPKAQRSGDFSVAELLDGPLTADPLRAHDIAPITDGAAAIVLAAGDVARSACERPAWIRGLEHRIEAHALGVRDLTRSESTRLAAEAASVGDGPVDVAELHAQFSHEELILADALGLGGATNVNPSGGALAANAVMSTGLVRIGEVARRIMAGDADRGVAHATSGPCLQQNMVCVLEGNRA